eukprot:TRINITY_DN3639_c0_g1_i1.p1 TRINITY_DN3639_c0_g1~~TRINITY_DN3639_c0_g1_i1.p1  ORF type:complete len:636 (-),score=257.98 TRINITY_DN3639_c0_g1_i1:20-1906(-)
MKKMNTLFFFVLVSLCALSLPHATQAEDNAANFGLGEGVLAAFGDWNSDKFVDAFVTSYDGNNTSITIYLWSTHNEQFYALPTSATIAGEVLNVTPGDFNYDGKLDLLVSTPNGSGGVSMTVYTGNYKDITGTIPIEEDAADQVLVFDANNDLMLDLFGSDTDGNPSVWISDEDGTFTRQAFAPLAGKTLAKPNSNAFVDMNGDCLADLVVTTVTTIGEETQLSLLVFQNSHDKTPGINYKLAATVLLPAGAGQITFADFDRDSSIDFVFPLINDDPNQIVVVFNNPSQGMCSSITGTGSNCYSPTELCSVSFLSLTDSVVSTNCTTGYRVSVTPLPDGKNFTNSPEYPATLRVGDYNLDGHPDLVFPITDTTSGDSVSAIFENIGCSGTGCCSRSFSNLVTVSPAGSYAATFVDLKESGDLDVLSLINNNGTLSTVTYLNNYLSDTHASAENFFLKVLGANGKCAQWCDSGAKFPDPRPIGVNMPGGVWKFTITDQKGSKTAAIQTQLRQNGYLALQTPYGIAGLGKVSNYIDTLFFGVSINSDATNYNSWPGIIPNSQVAAFPYPHDKPIKWLLNMYVIPSDITIWVVTACVVICVALAFAIFALMYKEKKADKKELLDRPFRFTM